MISIAQQISQEIKVKSTQVSAAIKLLDEGATVPFIARYRKEATQGLDDNHLRQLAARLKYLRDLAERRQVILTNIAQQQKLTAELEQAINQAESKTRLEDLYLPYKPKRKTKGQAAIKAGLAPLADKLFNDVHLAPIEQAQSFINVAHGFEDAEKVLAGVTAILAERMGEDANLLAKLRKLINQQAHIVSHVVKSKISEAAKYKDYFDHSEKLSKVASHRVLAMLRGKNEGYLRIAINVDPQSTNTSADNSAVALIFQHYDFRLTAQKGAAFLTQVVHYAWKQKLAPTLETEFLGLLREQAEQESIKVFAKNLTDLLMAAPAGAKTTLGIDPGIRTGCKIAVVDATGKLLHTSTIFPHAPQNNWDKSLRTIANLCRQFNIELIAIGNGTGSRETDKLAAEAIKQLEKNKPIKVMVSEAGASVYSASELAAQEFPDLDVSLRGAVSIARRLQDPLAELVKIDAKAIGVGQYQHDVNQSALTQSLDNVIEDCVNKVGVDLNSASPSLLTHIAGLNKTLAHNIVAFREQQGRFNNRKQLLKVTRLGPKAFEQAAGFLRINEGDNPLDATAVHPESYPVVEQILSSLNTSSASLLSDKSLLATIDKAQFISESVGQITLDDIVEELKKPARDPRPAFKTATFKEGVENITDLNVGMVLEGVVSNVANFGAFVDIGVHQDGLVHISAMTDKFISDPRELVKAGDIVKVKVMDVDVSRKRITLSMRLDDTVSANTNHNKAGNKNSEAPKKAQPDKKPVKKAARKDKAPANAAMGNAFADAFAKLKK